jgi:hypothetical protein
MKSEIKLPLECRCKKVIGEMDWSPGRGNNIICFCDDCQTFAFFLDPSGENLTSNGGSEIVQVTPSRVVFKEGKEHIKCLKLGPKGLIRWYTSCCKTPIANTINLKMPFYGVYHHLINFSQLSLSKEEL